jgi:hypothetical protein
MFRDWENFYLLIGSAAAALIGLLFVVVTLTTGREHSSVSRGTSIYTTPTVFHFALVLLISAVALSPGAAAPIAGPIIFICALAGLTYAVAIGVWLRTGSGPEGVHWSDFWWYGVGPAAIYLGLAIAAVALWAAASRAPAWVAVVCWPCFSWGSATPGTW